MASLKRRFRKTVRMPVEQSMNVFFDYELHVQALDSQSVSSVCVRSERCSLSERYEAYRAEQMRSSKKIEDESWRIGTADCGPQFPTTGEASDQMNCV